MIPQSRSGFSLLVWSHKPRSGFSLPMWSHKSRSGYYLLTWFHKSRLVIPFRYDPTNPLLHRLLLDHAIISFFRQHRNLIKKNYVKFWILLKILRKMERLLFWSKCSIFHNIKHIIFQRGQKALIWSKGLKMNDILNYWPTSCLELAQNLISLDKDQKFCIWNWRYMYANRCHLICRMHVC